MYKETRHFQYQTKGQNPRPIYIAATHSMCPKGQSFDHCGVISSTEPVHASWAYLNISLDEIHDIQLQIEKDKIIWTFAVMQQVIILASIIFRRFEKKHLAQMMAVYPSAYHCEQKQSLHKESVYELTVQFGSSKPTLQTSELISRRKVFQSNLLALTKKHHQVKIGSGWICVAEWSILSWGSFEIMYCSVRRTLPSPTNSFEVDAHTYRKLLVSIHLLFYPLNPELLSTVDLYYRLETLLY